MENEDLFGHFSSMTDFGKALVNDLVAFSSDWNAERETMLDGYLDARGAVNFSAYAKACLVENNGSYELEFLPDGSFNAYVVG